MNYYVSFNGIELSLGSYSEAISLARRKSKEYGSSRVVCEQMQDTEYTNRRVSTLLWADIYVNGACEKRSIINKRLSRVTMAYIPVEDWNLEMEEMVKHKITSGT